MSYLLGQPSRGFRRRNLEGRQGVVAGVLLFQENVVTLESPKSAKVVLRVSSRCTAS